MMAQALHPLAAGDDDGARADEADTGHHLRAQAGHIREVVHVQIEILAGQRGHGGPQADEDMGAEARRTALVLPLDADDAAADHRQQHADGDGKQGHIPQSVKDG